MVNSGDLIRRFLIERKKFDRSGIYGYTQRFFAYNSNRIEGSALSEEQVSFLLDTGMLPASSGSYRARDIEEACGHFLTFLKMIDTLDRPLSAALIKALHYELRVGVFDDRVRGYAIGGYRARPSRTGEYGVTPPEDVALGMDKLLRWYHGVLEKDLAVLAEFHARFMDVFPFQGGNGQIGRLVLFRECLVNGMVLLIVEATDRGDYLAGLKEHRERGSVERLLELFKLEQARYSEAVRFFLSECGE